MSTKYIPDIILPAPYNHTTVKKKCPNCCSLCDFTIDRFYGLEFINLDTMEIICRMSTNALLELWQILCNRRLVCPTCQYDFEVVHSAALARNIIGRLFDSKL